jgi:hypothetical protein
MRLFLTESACNGSHITRRTAGDTVLPCQVKAGSAYAYTPCSLSLCPSVPLSVSSLPLSPLPTRHAYHNGTYAHTHTHAHARTRTHTHAHARTQAYPHTCDTSSHTRMVSYASLKGRHVSYASYEQARTRAMSRRGHEDTSIPDVQDTVRHPD